MRRLRGVRGRPRITGGRRDLGVVVPGIVKVLDGRDGVTYPGPLGEPEEAFAAVAEMYGLSTP